jgi:hypothetical protein
VCAPPGRSAASAPESAGRRCEPGAAVSVARLVGLVDSRRDGNALPPESARQRETERGVSAAAKAPSKRGLFVGGTSAAAVSVPGSRPMVAASIAAAEGDEGPSKRTKLDTEVS